METLLREILKPFHRTAFLAGSGISITAPTNFSSGQQFTQQLLKTISPNTLCLKRLLELSASAPDVNSAEKPFIRFENILLQIANLYDFDLDLLDYFSDSKPNQNHYFLAKAIGEGHPVLTTNFDLEIEHACEEIASDFERIITDNELQCLMDNMDPKAYSKTKGSLSESGMLFKIHGSLDNKESLCATLIQIGKLGYRWTRAPHRAMLLDHIFSHYPVIVFGYSGLDDFDINPVLEQIKEPKPLIWVNHEDNIEPTLENIKAMYTAPDILRRFLKTSYRHSDIHLVQGDTGKFLTKLSNVLNLPIETKRATYPNPKVLHKRNLSDYLNSWAIHHGLNEIGRKRVLCASLFASVDMFDFAKETITDDAIEMTITDLGHRENILGSEAFRTGDWSSASSHFRMGFGIFSSIGDALNCSVMLNNLGNTAINQGRIEEAKQFYEASLDMRLHSENPRGVFAPLAGLATVSGREGNLNARKYFLSLALNASIEEGELDVEAKLSMLLEVEYKADTQQDIKILLNDWRGLLQHLSKGLSLGWSYQLEATDRYVEVANRRNKQIHDAQSSIPKGL
ncbi:SIR2 family protein, partial [Planctomycetota bacterium]